MGKRKINFDKMISFRLPGDVAKSWHDAAKKSSMSLTDFIKSQIDIDGVEKFSPKRKTPVPKLKYVAVDPALVQQVARIGNNLNQISRFCNTYKEDADSLEIITHLTAIEHEIKRVLD